MAHPADPYPHWYRATADVPHFGVWRGDLIRYNPTATPEMTVVRRLPPNHGGLLLAIEEGWVTRLADDPSVSSLAAAREPRGDSPPPTPAPGRVVATLPWSESA